MLRSNAPSMNEEAYLESLNVENQINGRSSIPKRKSKFITSLQDDDVEYQESLVSSSLFDQDREQADTMTAGKQSLYGYGSLKMMGRRDTEDEHN